jgi:hypothetical protein
MNKTRKMTTVSKLACSGGASAVELWAYAKQHARTGKKL